MPRHIARWDLDKTYLRTDFDTLRDLVRTALERPDEKRTNPGASTLMREMVRAGVMLAADGLQPSSKGARVTFSGGKRTVIDGPFTETKEIVGGFALMEAKSREEAIEMTTRFLKIAGDGECELHRIQEHGDNR